MNYPVPTFSIKGKVVGFSVEVVSGAMTFLLRGTYETGTSIWDGARAGPT